MALFDWNHNGKKDMVDDYIEYQIYKETMKNKDTNNYSSGETKGMSTFEAIVALIGGVFVVCLLVNDIEEVPGIVVAILWILASFGIAFIIELFNK